MEQTNGSSAEIAQVLAQMQADAAARDKAHRREGWLKIGMAALVAAGLAGGYYLAVNRIVGSSVIETDGPSLALVKVHGVISAASETASASKLTAAIKTAAEDDDVKKIVLHIDSPGGAPVEAERIMEAVRQAREKHKKPVVAVISNLGASAGYMVALSADSIVSGRFSLVGSVGAVLQSWDVHGALDKIDVKARSYASGELKAMLNPFEPQTPEAQRKAQALVDVLGRQFLDLVAERRKDKLTQPIASYASGEVWNGEEARALGLVDENGTFETEVAKSPDLEVVDFSPRPKRTVSQLISSSVADGVRIALESQALTLR